MSNQNLEKLLLDQNKQIADLTKFIIDLKNLTEHQKLKIKELESYIDELEFRYV